MANKVTSPDKEIIKYHTKDGDNILGTGITYGINIEYNLSDRRVLRFGIFHSHQSGKTQIIQESMLPFDNNPSPGYYYHLTINESQIHFPLAFKYRFLKTKHKFSPYILAGYRIAYTYKHESIYANTDGYIPRTDLYDHTAIYNKWRKSNVNGIILEAGVNYNFTNKISIYLEPLYRRTGGYLGYHISGFGLKSFNYWGLGFGVNYKL